MPKVDGGPRAISLKLCGGVQFLQIATRQQVIFGTGALGFQLTNCAICMRNSQIACNAYHILSFYWENLLLLPSKLKIKNTVRFKIPLIIRIKTRLHEFDGPDQKHHPDRNIPCICDIHIKTIRVQRNPHYHHSRRMDVCQY
jgi:hypothetical protein